MPADSYRSRVVAFLDVLGASSALSSPNSARRFSEGLAAILSALVSDKQHAFLALPHILTGDEVDVENSLLASPGARVTTISDAITISVPLSSRPKQQSAQILDCIENVRILQRGLLTLGVRTRGGLTIGGLLHNNRVVVGEALVRAHHLESVIARYPRTIVDEPVIDALINNPFPAIALFENRLAHAIRQDDDGKFFIDYLSYDPMGSLYLLERMHGFLEQNTNDMSGTVDSRVREKLVWMDKYIRSSIEARRDLYPSMQYADPRFSRVFKRTDDNLRSWVDEFVRRRSEK